MDISRHGRHCNGRASGLGEATARRLAALGVKVALFDMNEERGQLVKDIAGLFCKTDVTSEASADPPWLRTRGLDRKPFW